MVIVIQLFDRDISTTRIWHQENTGSIIDGAGRDTDRDDGAKVRHDSSAGGGLYRDPRLLHPAPPHVHQTHR